MSITKEDLKNFIVDTVEQANDKKLGRIISLLFRATSHIDMVKEQNNMFYRLIHSNYNWLRKWDYYEDICEFEHQITRYATEMIENRDKENIERHHFRNKKE